MARVGGAWADLSEHRLVEQLDGLPAHERERLYRRRKRHREVMILLHEWAHTMGADHVREREYLMNPFYDIRASEFSPQTAALIRKALTTVK